MYDKRIIVFGTRGQELTSRHLEAFLQQGANIVALVEAPPGTIISVHAVKTEYEEIDEVARRLDIPLFTQPNPNAPEFVEQLRQFEPDLFLVLCYQFFLKGPLLSLPSQGAINFHTSLLPRHAGRHPGFWTIWYGDKESGMTVHYLDEGLDTGDTVYQTRVPVPSGDTIDALYKRIWATSVDLTGQFLDDLQAGTFPRVPQDRRQYLYNYEIEDKDYELDFRWPAEVLYGRVKMAPGKFYVSAGDGRYYVEDCTVVDEHVASRNCRTGVPFRLGDKPALVTPRQFLRIDAVLKDGQAVDPLRLLQ